MLIGGAATATTIVAVLIAVPGVPQGAALALGGTLGLAATGLLAHTRAGERTGRVRAVVAATAIGWTPILAARLLAG